MNNEPLKQIANKVLSNVVIQDKDKERFSSVIIILSIISIILTLVRVIQECDKNKIKLFNKQAKYDYFSKQIHEISIRRSWFTKMTIKKILRKELNMDDYRQYGVSITNVILSVAENLKESEVKTLVEAANV
jgi:hypothetical protein